MVGAGKNHPASLANLMQNRDCKPQWKAGESPNPGGWPRGTHHVKKRLKNALIRYLRDNPEKIPGLVKALVDAGSNPDGVGFSSAQKILWDRIDGILQSQTKLDVNVSFVKRYIDDAEEPEPSNN